MLIYQITNLLTGKAYIGLTEKRSVNRRWIEHKWFAKSGTKTALYSAMRSYGVDNFKIEAIVALPSDGTRDELEALERDIIQDRHTVVPNGYNISEGGDGLRAGPNNPNNGRKLTPEHLAKTAKQWTPERRARAAQLCRDRNAVMNRTPEHAARLKAAWDKNPARRAKTAETARKILGAYTKSPEHRTKMSEKMKLVVSSPEWKRNIRLKLQSNWVKRRQLKDGLQNQEAMNG